VGDVTLPGSDPHDASSKRSSAGLSPKILIPAALVCIGCLFQWQSAMAPAVSGILWAIAGAMLVLAVYQLTVWRLVKVQISAGVLLGVAWFWWQGSPHAALRVVKADQGIEWGKDGSAQVRWTARIENKGSGTSVHGHLASKLIPGTEGGTAAAAAAAAAQVADAAASLKREIEQQHGENREPFGSAVLASGAQKDYTIQLEPLSVNRLRGWKAEDRLVAVYLLRLEYSDWHGFYRHVRYVCRFGLVSDRDKRPCPSVDDL
jgi:hypothetical protein